MTFVWITVATGWLAAVVVIASLCRVAARGDAALCGARESLDRSRHGGRGRSGAAWGPRPDPRVSQIGCGDISLSVSPHPPPLAGRAASGRR